MAATSDTEHWAQLKEAGTLRGFHFLLWVHKVFGRGIFSACLYPVMLYFLLARKVARRASLDFLTTHYHYAPQRWKTKPGYRHVYRHFMAFGQAILEKLLAWSTEIAEEEFLIEDQAAVDDLLNDPRGQLIIGTHLGNLEYCRGFMQRYKNKAINVLLYDQHAANFVKMMQHVNNDSRMRVYQVTELDIPTVLQLKTKVDNGEWLFIAGDRVPVSGRERTVNTTFMGRAAPLPIGPYMLAQTLQCPVKLMFSYRLKDKVKFRVVPFAERVTLPRADREGAVRQYAQQFANDLEKQCVEAPFQWFNFYCFWSDDNKTRVNGCD